MDGYATTLAEEHRNDEAEKLLRETLDIRHRVLGPDHRDTLMSMNNLANMLFLEGHYADAEKLEREALAIQRRVLGPDHPDTAMSTYNLGGIALHKGKPDEALSLLREAVDHGLAPNIALQLEKEISRRCTVTRASLTWFPMQRTRRGCAKTKLVGLCHWRLLLRDSGRVTGQNEAAGAADAAREIVRHV
jgi:tetratricopeptide (TPR) repeat protein